MKKRSQGNKRPKGWDRPPVEIIYRRGCMTQPFETPPAPTNTACKHGFGECEECGTTAHRDVRHTTTDGRGVVGAAIERSRGRR
jgi:hypothetical protein